MRTQDSILYLWVGFFLLCFSQVHCQSCIVRTTNGRTCIIPFSYNGVVYTDCTGQDNQPNNNAPWCATGNYDYNIDEMWGHCIGSVASCPPAETTPRNNFMTARPASTLPNAVLAKLVVNPVCVVRTRSGRNCVIPFVYRGVRYTDCTDRDNFGVKWCAVTHDFPNDQEWGTCIGSIEQNCNPPKDCTVQTDNGGYCSFPFVYKGFTFIDCTNMDNGHAYWCSISDDYPRDRRWGNCLGSVATRCMSHTGTASTCSVHTTRNEVCVFPFTYKRVVYQDCTAIDNGGRLWCATTGNYPQDKKWGNCQGSLQTNCFGMGLTTPPLTPGSTGLCVVNTESGRQCVFPFIFNSQSYDDCIVLGNNNRHWCATTPNYDRDQQWGNCIGTRVSRCCHVQTTEGVPCVFPFTFNGVLYEDCTPDGNGGVPWCAVTADYPRDKRWGNCDGSVRDCSMLTTPGPVTCQVMTVTGRRCAIPFVYSGATYNDCTTIDSGANRPWCATTNNFDQDREWDYCIGSAATNCPVPTQGPQCPRPIRTVDGNANGAFCVFPFVYQNQMYNDCIQNVNWPVRWCATTSNYDTDGQWGNCAC